MSFWTGATLVAPFLLGSFNLALAKDEYAPPSISTQSLYDDCRGKDLSFCHGFVTGVANAMMDIRTMDVNLRQDYCPAASETNADRAALFIRWAETHRVWKSSAYDAVYNALWFGEPCKNG